MTTITQRRKRKSLAPEDILIPVCVRLTLAQKQKLMTLGGGPWLRERLRRTAASRAQTVPTLDHLRPHEPDSL